MVYCLSFKRPLAERTPSLQAVDDCTDVVMPLRFSSQLLLPPPSGDVKVAVAKSSDCEALVLSMLHRRLTAAGRVVWSKQCALLVNNCTCFVFT